VVRRVVNIEMTFLYIAVESGNLTVWGGWLAAMV
jgi:hypothetical protein